MCHHVTTRWGQYSEALHCWDTFTFLPQGFKYNEAVSYCHCEDHGLGLGDLMGGSKFQGNLNYQHREGKGQLGVDPCLEGRGGENRVPEAE